ncbi:MAG: hypothetical protein M3125_03190, partial [Gemmatimonadota bacterium]|nr:hypothetical protein [Gemmatimonadota bacterium]
FDAELAGVGTPTRYLDLDVAAISLNDAHVADEIVHHNAIAAQGMALLRDSNERRREREHREIPYLQHESFSERCVVMGQAVDR